MPTELRGRQGFDQPQCHYMIMGVPTLPVNGVKRDMLDARNLTAGVNFAISYMHVLESCFCEDFKEEHKMQSG